MGVKGADGEKGKWNKGFLYFEIVMYDETFLSFFESVIFTWSRYRERIRVNILPSSENDEGRFLIRIGLKRGMCTWIFSRKW